MTNTNIYKFNYRNKYIYMRDLYKRFVHYVYPILIV